MAKVTGRKKKTKNRWVIREGRLDPEFLKAMGTILKVRRQDLALTQQDVARYAGWSSQASVWKIESGHVDPYRDQISRIHWLKYLEALGWTEKDLARQMGYEDEGVFLASGEIEHREVPSVKTIEGEGEIVVLGMPELDKYREKDLTLHSRNGERLVVAKEKEYEPGDILLIDTGEGKELGLLLGWEKKTASTLRVRLDGTPREIPLESVVGKVVLRISEPEISL